MASRVGAPINVTFGASFTVPSGANAFIASGIWYDGANQAVTAVSGSRITVDNVAAVASSGSMGVYSVRGRVNSNGSDTWSITKAGFFSEGPTCQVQFYSVADNTNFVRQQQVVGDTSGAISRSVTSTTSDLVDAWIMSDGGGTVSGAISGFTAVGTEQTTNADKSRVHQANSPGASSTSITGPANSYPGLVLVSVYDSGGGGVSGSLSATESGSDTAAASGTVKVQGALSVTEAGGDTSAIAGTVRVSGSLAVTESGGDTAAIVGGSVATGSLDATETGSDTAAVSGVVLVQGALSTTETGSDTASLSGVVVVAGALAATEAGSDTSAIAGVVLVQGALAVTEDGPDTFAATGSLSGGVNGSLNATESGSDTFAASGSVPVSGSLSVTETDPDSAVISGLVVVSGALAVSESGADQFAAEGIASIRTGSMDAVEQGSDTALILGEGAEPEPSRTHGFVITDTAPRLWWQRKPKALDEEEAEERVTKLVRVVERIARKQVERTEPAPSKERKREVREAIAPMVEQMPGFDWMAVYRTILIELERRKQAEQARLLAEAEIARIRAIEQDDDDALLLMLSI